MNKTFPKVFSLALVLALVLSAFPVFSIPTSALSSGVVISQIYGGGGNAGAPLRNDFVELFNRGTSPVSLTGWSIQYASATGTGNFAANSIATLSGTLAPGQYYLVQLASGGAVGALLPTPDATGTQNMSGTGAKVALVNTTTGLACNGSAGQPCSAAQLAQIVDLVGWDGANFFETAPAPTTTNTTSVSRKTNGCTETDNNANDFTAGTPAPRNTSSPLNVCPVDSAPAVSSTDPTNSAVNVPLDSNITINFSEAVSATGSWFTLSCTTSGAHTATLSGGPTTFTLDVDTDFVRSENCTLTILAASVTDQDVNDPPDNMGANYILNFSTFEVCGDPAAFVHDVQGSGATSPIAGSVVAVEGIVVGDFQNNASLDNGDLNGFHVQEENAEADADPSTSEGIFVFAPGGIDVSVGDKVRVRGTVSEFFNLTEIDSVSNLLQCSTGNALPASTSVNLPVTSLNDFERYEGMRVAFPQALVISEYFNYERFGETVLALPLDGETRPFTGTAIDEPGAPALDRALKNSLRRITLDDGLSTENPNFVRHPNGDYFALDNRFRGGDTIQNTVGVMDFAFGLYRIQPTGSANYTAVNPRTDAPEPVSGNLRVAAMNTLNFFLTQDYPTGNPLDNKCGPAQNVECRGADFNQPDEFSRQRVKLLEALKGLDGDIIGLNELENTTGVDPLGDPTNGIVAGLNAMLGAGTYDYIDTGVVGTDAIRVGLIYKPAKVTPIGDFELLTSADDPRFVDTLNRPALAQTFEEVATGARFTVVVNHLKSKGSACAGDPDIGDGQGNCNQTRKRAAQALVDWLATDPTGSGDPDFLIMGDLNSYAQEDPIDAIKAGADDTA
ncbi:MAG TPA: ExeM/NucH family extracellular endonuclease, partial [Anaerolineales bacterium]|nr:ExeM/NucH family extracellular endonuclease [Anaerolineales bacterium]